MPASRVLQRAAERFEDVLVRQVEAARVAPHAAVQLGRPHDRRMRRAERSALLSDPARGLDRIGDQLVDVDVRVGDAIDERRVGAVLQQAADQVCEQRLVGADRRIDAARPAEPAVGARRDDVGVQRLAHSVQALEFVQSAVRVVPRQRRDGGQRVRVVGRELRVDRIRRGEQLAGAGEIRDVGVALAREDRVVVEAVDLRALDLAVPVRAFDEPDHQTMPAAAREVDQVRKDCRAALLVGLHDETDAMPAVERGLHAEALEQVEGKVEALGLLGIDVEADVVRTRHRRELAQARIELVEDTPALRAEVARMQRRELDRDARALVDTAAGRSLADRIDRVAIRRQVALRVGLGQRRLAEHVVRIAEALALAPPGAHQRLLDRLAGDELLAHQPHRHVDAAPHDRLAAAREEPRQRAGKAPLGVGRDQLAGQQQAPRRGIHEDRRAAAQMGLPIGVADLVADQRVASRSVGNAQQRLGQAHQGDALLRRQRELLDQALDQALASARDLARAQLRRRAARRAHAPRRPGRPAARPYRSASRRRPARAGGGPR